MHRKILRKNKKNNISKECIESEYLYWLKKKNIELAERKRQNEVFNKTKRNCSLLLQKFNSDAYQDWLESKQRDPSEYEPLPAMRIWKPLRYSSKPTQKPWIPAGPSTFSNQEITNYDYVNYE